MSSEKSQWEPFSILQDALRASLTSTKNSKQHLAVAKEAARKIELRSFVKEGEGIKITETASVLFLRCIIQPYAVRTFKAKTKTCVPLVDCLHRFLFLYPAEMAGPVLSVLLKNKQYKETNSSVAKVLKNQNRAMELESESKETSVAIILELLTIDGLEYDDVDSILVLLRHSIDYLKAVLPSEASDSDSSGTVDNVHAAYFASLSSKPLLSHLFALDRGHGRGADSDNCSVSSLTSYSDKQSSDDDYVSDLEYFVLRPLQSITERSELLDAFLESLRYAYHFRAHPKQSEHQKSQLKNIWDAFLQPENAFVLDQCIDYFTSFPFPNSVLLLDLVEVIFICSANYSEKIPLYRKISALVSRVEMNMSALNPTTQFLDRCSSFVGRSYMPEVWRLERLWLFSLLCGESSSAVINMEARECDAFLKSLFGFCASHKEMSAPTSLDQETMTVVSCVRKIANCFSASRPQSVLSSFLEAVIENFKEHRFLFDFFLSDPFLEKCAEGVTNRNVEVVFMLFDNCGQESVPALIRLLEIMLHSPQGRDTVRTAAVNDFEWVAVGKKCLSSLKRKSKLDRNVIVSCVLALCAVNGESHFDIVVELLPFLYEHIIDADIPYPDFVSLIRLLLAHHNSSTSSLSSFVGSVLEIISKSDDLKHPLSLFDNFLLFLNEASISDQQKLLCVFHSQMKQIIDLLIRDLHKDTKIALHKISRLALDVDTAALERQYEAKDSESSRSKTSLSSGGVSGDQTPQREGELGRDLHITMEILERPDLVLKNGAIGRASLTQSVPRDDVSSMESEQSLIVTPAAQENIELIEGMIEGGMTDEGRALHLQGGTGVGKIAAVAAVAHRRGVKLVRISGASYLSSRSYLARTSTRSVDEGTEAFYENQLFAEAFENGQWVLFEQLNLVPKEVFKLVRGALESKEIVLCNRSSALNSRRVIKMHKKFLFFATDDRLNPVSWETMYAPTCVPLCLFSFKEPSCDESNEILKQSMKRRLKDPNEAELERRLSTMSMFHFMATGHLTNRTEGDQYPASTIRTLLAWGNLLTQNGVLTPLTDPSFKRCTWLVYGAHVEEPQRISMRKILKARLEITKPLSFLKDVDSTGPKYTDLFNQFAELRSKKPEHKQILVGQFWRRHFPSETTLAVEMATEFEICADVHSNVMKTITSADFIVKYGMHTSFSEFWLVDWISEAKNLQLLSQEQHSELGKLGASLYMSSFHNKGARGEIRNVFAKSFELRHSVIKLHPSLVPEMPIVLTKQLARMLTLILDGLRIEHPILLKGCAGVGKTSIGKALAFLLGEGLHQMILNTESEPSLMLGEQIPVSGRNSERKVAWKDGPLTKAFKEGSVCLVDNIGQGEPVLQERLNPILESPKYLCLTENGESQPLQCKLSSDGKKVLGPARGFQFIATYTPKGPPASGLDSSSRHLNDSFFFRFITVHVDNPSDLNQEEFQSLIEGITTRLCKKAVVKKIVDFCLKVKEALSRHCHFVSFGSYVSLIHITTLLCQRYPDHDLLTLLSCALLASFGAQMDNPITKTAIRDATNCIQNPLDALELLAKVKLEGDFVLTDCRRSHAQTALLGVVVNKPVLLEGKPSVGKTALVGALKGAIDGSSEVKILSNSETTTLQDYLGTWMPHGDEFVFSKGILVQAMERGDWFVSDEFNLAPSVVISVLMAFFEGDRVVEIPNADLKIHVHPRFRFFATLNSHEGERHQRNLLPVHIRNRFLEIHLDDV